MAADSLNRETIRDALASVLTTALVGSGLPVQAVYGYKVGDFSSQSPVVVVTSAGSDRTRPGTFETKWNTAVRLDIWVFIHYANIDRAGTVVWTEANTDDRLDLIEKEIADALLDSPDLGGVCDEVMPAGETQIGEENFGGRLYRTEVIPVIARKTHG